MCLHQLVAKLGSSITTASLSYLPVALCVAIGLSPTRAHALDVGERLLLEFENPYEGVDCSSVPILEYMKFGCGFEYLTALPEYLAAREAALTERLEIERGRAWTWFDGPPLAGNCEVVPELERAKFVHQCRPNNSGTDALGLFELNLERLKTKRDSLADRIEIVRKDFERLQARQAALGRLSPDDQARIDDFQAVLNALDRALLKEQAIARFVFEIQRNSTLDLSGASTITIEDVPGEIILRQGPATDTAGLGAIVPGDVVVVVNMDTSAGDQIAVVHRDLGLGYVARSEFYGR